MKEKNERRPYTVHGRIRHFSQKEIEAILEKHIPKECLLPERFEVAEKPTDGKCFKVEIAKINFSLFWKKRSDEQQERTRKLILEAFIEVLKKPEKYEVFYLLIPEKEWVYGDKKDTTVEEQMNFAERIGGYTGTWIEEALGWAQQITNGAGTNKAWQTVCNNPDTLKWYRLRIWKNGKARLGGGSSEIDDVSPASDNVYYDYNSKSNLRSVVPSVVLKSLHCTLSNY